MTEEARENLRQAVERENGARTSDTGTLLADYLTEKELAAEFGVTRKTIRNWRALGEAPTITRIGRKILYSRVDIKNWLDSQRREVV